MTRLQNWRTQMYLSRIKLNTQKRETMKALVNPQQIHGAIEVLNGEPSEASDAADEKNRARSLWRIDTLGGEMYLLVLTQDRPKLSRAAEQLGYGGINVETKSYDPLLARIAEGSRWRFRLTANPTKSIKREDDPQARGKVTALISVGQQEEWLASHAQSYGFELAPDEFRVVHSNRYSFKKRGKNKEVRLLSVTFEGILTVTDAARFRETLTQGLGRGKAYGNGLMTVVGIGEGIND